MTQLQINTLTPTYDNLEDRIRLSLNYQDIDNRLDLMITRNFILDLIPTIEDYISKFYPNHIENSTCNEEIIEPIIPDNEIDTLQTQTNMEDLTLYRSKEELLLTVKFTFNKDTKLTFLQFISVKNNKAVLNSDINMLKNILKTLKDSIPRVQWGISRIF